MRLSSSDKRIIEALQRDGRTSLTSISKELGISHVAVKKRIDKLEKEGVLKVKALLSSKLFVYAIILAELEGFEYINEVVSRLRECPRMVLLAPLLGGINFIAIMAFENEDVLESCMGSCIVRTMKGIRRSEVYIARDLAIPRYVLVRTSLKKAERAPCGVDCGKCPLYIANRKCLGCPATKYYREPS